MMRPRGSGPTPTGKDAVRRFGWLLLAVPSLIPATACVLIFERSEVRELTPGAPDATVVESPLKAFMTDGSIVVYPQGARISGQTIQGTGVRHALGLTDSTHVTEIVLDSVTGIEAFQATTEVGRSVVLSVLATGVSVVAGAFLAVAIFGSCPTVYAHTDAGLELQSEAFSYSISPLLESRDVDRLELTPDEDGVIRLELRNEALETHYINHLELLGVSHGPDVRALSDERGLPLGAGTLVPPTRALDRDGRDVLPDMVHRDSRAFSSTVDRIVSASSADSRDHVELAFPPLPDADTAVVVLDLRNSLLNTVLFYDLMLASQGAGALDWLGRSIERIDTAVELGRWFQETMGLTVEVFDGSTWRQAARIGDSGPIAWKQTAVRVPLLEPDSVRIRLTFLADGWRIDRVAIAEPRPLGAATRLPLTQVTGLSGRVPAGAVDQLGLPDEGYFVTHPGTAVQLEFPGLEVGLGASATYFLSTQGYYTEWVRPAWIQNAGEGGPFRPDEGTVEELMARWLDQKDWYEQAFFDSRIPVR